MPAPAVEAPGAVTASVDSTTATTATISWTGGSGATAFNVFRSGSSGVKGTEVASNVTSPWQDTGLTAETSYWYTVEAENGAGTTDSNQVQATTQAASGSGITTLASIRWTNGLGTSQFAWTDGDVSRDNICNASTINPTVLAAATEGWSGPGNVFRVQNTTAGCGGLSLQDLMPTPTNGDVWVLRWSYKQSVDQIRDHQHTILGFSSTAVGEGKVILGRTGENIGGNWHHKLGLAPATFSWESRNAGNTDRLNFAPNTWYRFEMAIQWSTQDAQFLYYRAYPRVYDASGTLIATEANYRANYLDGEALFPLMSEYYANGGFLRYPIAGLTNSGVGDNIRDFWLGVSRSYDSDVGLMYYAGVDVGIADEITYYGAY